MKHILVPTDFSDCAADATEVALAIARKTGAEVLFLHSLDVPVGWTHIPKDAEDYYPGVQKEIGVAKGQLGELTNIAKMRGIEASEALAFSKSYLDVAQTLKDKKHDLIVLGSHGRSGMEKLMLGSVAEKIIRRATSPVLIVQKRPEIIDFQTIVFASGTEEDTHGAFGRLLEFAKEMGARHLHFVEVTTPHNFKPTKQVRDQMEAFVRNHDFQTLKLHNYNHFNIESGILEFAHNVKADLIALATHGRNDLSSLFVESIPENLVKYSDFPVLSIRV